MITSALHPAIRVSVTPRRRKPLDITVGQVEERLHEAVVTLALIPDRERRFIYHRQSSWPDTLREAIDVMAEALDRVRDGKSAFGLPTVRQTPTKEAIDRMDEALDWLTWLDGRDLALVTLRAFDLSWTLIGDRMHAHRSTVERWHDQAVKRVHGHLRAGDAPEVKPRAADAHATRHLRRMTRRLFR